MGSDLKQKQQTVKKQFHSKAERNCIPLASDRIGWGGL